MKNYFKKNMAKAFSLTETIIMLTILAIAVASMTPMVTRKIINNTEAGTTINGVSHGRYEIYSKEIVTYGTTSYEKTTKPMPENPENIKVLVFERLDDLAYKKYANKSPEMNNKGQKSTLYEQIENAKPYRTPSGDIDYVEFKKNGETKKYPVGGSIIVESSDVIYKQGTLTMGNPATFTEATGAGTVTLPNNTHRIIEGVLTKKFNKKSDDNNILWHIDAKNDNSDNFEGTVTVIPWEKVISGKNVIVDKPIEKDALTGQYIGSFDPGVGTKSLVLHAVGGGGAGGGLKDVGTAITPKTANEKELDYMKQTLAKRFKEVAKAKGASEANIDVNTLVKIVDVPNLYSQDYKTQFGGEESNTYILINKADGTITVKVDVRNGLVFPHELLDYTNILGSQTQKEDNYDMPIWGDYQTVVTGGERGKPFYAGGTACGGAGGAGGTYEIESQELDFTCKRASYCTLVKQEKTRPYHCLRPYVCTMTDSKGNSFQDFCCAQEHDDYQVVCKWLCSGGTVYDPEPQKTYKACYAYPECGALPPQDEFHKKPSCRHKMIGGAGGAAPPCATACTLASEPIGEIAYSCGGSGSSGGATPNPVNINENVSVTGGTAGESCFVGAGSHMASSIGGKGGTPCAKIEMEVLEMDLSKSNDPAVVDFNATLSFALALNAHPIMALEFAYAAVYASHGMQGLATAMYVTQVAMPALATTNGTINVTLDNGNVIPVGVSNGVISMPGAASSVVQSAASAAGATTDVRAKFDYAADEGMACTAPQCGGSIKCGADGAAGTASSDCADTTGINTSHGGNGKKYNHIYSWTFPFAINKLAYGEAGEAGEYKTTKIATTTGPFEIRLGIGGSWDNPKDPTSNWAKGKRGPDGTDTIIKMSGRNILTAKGGKGGTQDLHTYRYNLCYASADKCKKNGKEIDCCVNEIGKRSTKEILTTASKMSAFENIKALTGNSVIIGIGLGRGGEGAGSRAQVEELKGLRVFRNASGYNVSYGDSQVKKEQGTYMADVTPENLAKFKNYALAPSALNFKGGDGAVIITW